jgi:glycine hydroxymethyltransferase
MKMQKNIQELINLEMQRQSVGIELIASENYQSFAVLETQASVFANKYAEGFPGRRYYGGQENTDQLEQLVINHAKEIFHADHANVQALSGAAANLCFYSAAMEP